MAISTGKYDIKELKEKLQSITTDIDLKNMTVEEILELRKWAGQTIQEFYILCKIELRRKGFKEKEKK